MARISPPLRWFGGKYYLAGKIAAIIDGMPHTTYVEPYGGAASILLNKAPSPIEVWNDIDDRLVNFFRVLRDPASRERLLEALTFTLFARAEFTECCREPLGDDPVESARRFFVLCQQSVSSSGSREKMTPGSWAKSVGVSRRGMSQNASRWWGNIENLPVVADRLARVQVESLDALELMRQYDRPATLHYLDPPYVHDSRVHRRAYKHEMTDEQHVEMIDCIRALKGAVVLSGYDNDIYRSRFDGWSRIDIPSKARSSTVGSTRGKSAPPPDRIEVLWLNPLATEATQQVTLG